MLPIALSASASFAPGDAQIGRNRSSLSDTPRYLDVVVRALQNDSGLWPTFKTHNDYSELEGSSSGATEGGSASVRSRAPDGKLPPSALLLLSDRQRLPEGVWQRAGHERRYGKAFKNATVGGALLRWSISDRFARLLKASSLANPRRDVYAFGVYTGGSVRGIARTLSSFGGCGFHWLWAFDSFSGLPHEATDLHLEGRHWKAGAFSASDALGVHNEKTLLSSIWRAIDHPNVTLVSGYYEDSLPKMPRAQLLPALLVDVDVDLYVSAKQALRWLFTSGLIVPGTLVRYDDWSPHVKLTGTGGLPPDSGNASSWGEMRAHGEITREFGVTWEPVSCGGGGGTLATRTRCEVRVVSLASTR